jgi:putative addiction module antidote
MKIKRKISKFGNSLGITLPKEALKLAGLKEGNEIEIEVETTGIKIIVKKL